MASDKSFYPDGTDMSYFDVYDREVTLQCPECKEEGIQIVTVDGGHMSMNASCDYCDYVWEEEWYEEPDVDIPDYF